MLGAHVRTIVLSADADNALKNHYEHALKINKRMLIAHHALKILSKC
jgi:hypothetical protein